MSIKPFWPHQSYLTLMFPGGLSALSVTLNSDIKVTPIIVLRSLCTITSSIIYPCVIELGMYVNFSSISFCNCDLFHSSLHSELNFCCFGSIYYVPSPHSLPALLWFILSWGLMDMLFVSLVCKIPSNSLCFPEFPEWGCTVGGF